MLPSSLINTCKSVAASFLEVWLKSAVIVYSEAGCVGWRGRVCGSPMGRLFQVSLAKFKWLGPSPTPQMGSVSAGLPTLLELRLQQVCCAVSVSKEIVFSTCTCTFKQALRRKKKNFGKVECIYVDACQEEDYRVCSNGGPLIFLPVPMMQLWLVSGDNFFMTFKEIPQQIRCNYSLE